MLIVDTSAWIFYVDPRKNNTAHELISDFLVTCQKKLLTTDLIIEETHKWLVHHTYNTKKAAEILNQFNRGMLAEIVNIEEADRHEATLIVRKYLDHKLSYTDAMTVAITRRLKLKQVCTFETHFDLFPGIERVPIPE